MAIALSLVLFLGFWGLMLGQYAARKEVRLFGVLAAIGLFLLALWIGEGTAAIAMFPLFLISFVSKCCKLRWRRFAVWTLLPLVFSLSISVPRMVEVTHLLRTTPAESLSARLRPRVSTDAPISGPCPALCPPNNFAPRTSQSQRAKNTNSFKRQHGSKPCTPNMGTASVS